MRLSRMWRIVQIEKDVYVFHRGWRARWIYNVLWQFFTLFDSSWRLYTKDACSLSWRQSLQNILMDVIHQGWRPRWITPSEICKILHIIWKPNSIILFYYSFKMFLSQVSVDCLSISTAGRFLAISTLRDLHTLKSSSHSSFIAKSRYFYTYW